MRVMAALRGVRGQGEGRGSGNGGRGLCVWDSTEEGGLGIPPLRLQNKGPAMLDCCWGGEDYKSQRVLTGCGDV